MRNLVPAVRFTAKGSIVRATCTLIAFWALLHLLGCSDMNAPRSGPCAVENSIECQMERSAHVPN